MDSVDMNVVEKAQDAIFDPEVVNAMRTLSKFGLGVCVPHMHDEKGAFLTLPEEIVQFESGNKVSFPKSVSVDEESSIAVAWKWNDGVSVVGRCHYTSRNCNL